MFNIDKLQFKYQIGDRHHRLTILTRPYKKPNTQWRDTRYFVRLKCDCGKEFERSTRQFDHATECCSCRSKKAIQKTLITIENKVIEIPIGSQYERLTVTGYHFNYKGKRRIPVICVCGTKFEIPMCLWGTTKSCIKCREIIKHDTCFDLQEQTKKCTTCNQIKPLSQFGTDNKTISRKRADCKQCQSIKTRCRKFHMTVNQMSNMLLNQESRCAICRGNIDLYTCSIDHCHTTHKVRGLLCATCNSGLGFFYDNTAFLQNAIVYLNKHVN